MEWISVVLRGCRHGDGETSQCRESVRLFTLPWGRGEVGRRGEYPDIPPWEQ